MKTRSLLILALFFALAGSARAQGQLSPVPCPQFFSPSGLPLAGGLLYSYISSTLTPQPTYTDSTLGAQNQNPIILNAGGFPTSPSGSCGIWLNPNLTYKFVLQNSSGVQQWVVDNVGSMLNLSNTWSALQTFTNGISVSGSSTLNGTYAGNPTFTGVVTITGTLVAPLAGGSTLNVSPGNAEGWAGSDTGAWINSAYAALPTQGGTITLSPGAYTQNTPIVFGASNKPAMLKCTPGNDTTLAFTSSIGTAFTYNVAGGGSTHLWGGGVENCTFTGPGSGTAAIGITLGGTNGAEGVIRHNVKVTNFGAAEIYGNNTFLTECIHCVYIDNGKDLSIPNTLTNSGESFSYIDSAFANSSGTNDAACVSVAAPVNNLSFIGGSFDNCQLSMSMGQVHVANTHFENPNSGMVVPFVSVSGGRLALVDPDFSFDGVSAPTPSTSVACSAGVITANNESFFAASATLASDYNLSGTCEFHETGLKLSSGYTNLYLTTTSGAISTFGNNWASNQLVGAGDFLLSGSKLKVGQLNLNYYTFTPDNPSTFRALKISDPGADFTMGATLNATSGAYQSVRGTAGCTTAASTGASCSFTVTWPHAFAGTNYSTVCTPSGGNTNYPTAPFVTTKTTSNVTVNYVATTGAAATWAFVDCTGVMD